MLCYNDANATNGVDPMDYTVITFLLALVVTFAMIMVRAYTIAAMALCVLAGFALGLALRTLGGAL